MSAPRSAMQLPLDGIRVVEASAGTGKTFTIATLYLRLVLVRGLKVGEIVVATFTRAAAAELATRLRERLVLADGLLASHDLATRQPGDDGEATACRDVIDQALGNGATLADLRQRASEARLALDTANIGTLHGFCHRVLAEFGFDTGQALREPELVDDLRELQAEIVRDFWRRGSANAAVANLLVTVWKSPDALAKQVRDSRWRGRTIKLPEPDVHAAEAAFDAARARIAAWDDAALRTAIDALPDCISHPPTLKQRSALLRELHTWAQGSQSDGEARATAAKQAASLCARGLDSIAPRDVHADGPAFDDLEALCAAFAAVTAAQHASAALPAARLLRDACAYLEAELPKRLAARNQMGHDEAVARLAAALADPERGASAAARIRARWKAALIDEFQDTDRRQWDVVHALFGATSLVLVGDPKQAIYGFRGGDVYAWLEARAHAEGAALQLSDSYRSGTGMCRAVNALFSRPDAFIEAGITHPDIHSAAPVRPRALLRNGEVLPALQLWWIDPESTSHADNRLPSKQHAQAAIETACVDWIVRMLDDPSVALRTRDGAGERLLPQHIAVLVDSNAQAASMQAALGRAGVPAASNLRASVYVSDEADDLALLVDALAAPDDSRRARAAHASVLVGVEAAALAAGTDTSARAAWLERVAEWAAKVQRHGPLAWLHALVAEAAPRLLALPDGERRVANYLQLAELLQALHAASFGLDDLAMRYARARVEASEDAEAARLRLDTDANAVTVATVHAAKGLEYDVVLVPYALLGRDPNGNHDARPPLYWYHAGHDAHVAIGAAVDIATITRAATEIRAEDVRKFYVAITRASALCVLPWGPIASAEYSPVFHLLHAARRANAERLPLDRAGCRQALQELCGHAHGAAEIVDDPPTGQAVQRSIRTQAPQALHAREFTRIELERDWQTWSFSRLVRGGANQASADPAPGTGDANVATTPADDFEPGLAGARFGTAVHAALERTDFAAWRDATDVPASERGWIERSLRAEGLADSGGALQHAVGVIGACMRDALNAGLPCGVRLCDVAPAQRRAEIEFHLTLAAADTRKLYALLHQYGYQRVRSGVAPQRLHGLLTGKIDLAFLHAGCCHIIDWKTNHCPPYDATALDHEIALHDYDLQWLVYTLALHRWLRQQLTGYDYDRHVGEVYYLFVRGMRAGHGVHVDRPPRELVEQLDALFGGNGTDA